MPAIAVHHTATDTQSAWDGPGEVAKAPNEEKTLHYMHAWEEAGGDLNAKTTYKFPHHDAGTDTPANINGVNNALARLEQADIPAGDRAGVRSHLEAHREDAGLAASLQRERSSHEPIRCFEGAARPHERFWGLRNAQETGGEPELELYGVISEYSWFDDDVTPKMFKDDLYKLGAGGPVTVRINSPGGSLDAASVIRAMLATYPGPVTTRIDGICASAATLVALAGEKIKIQDTGTFMIHEPWIGVMFAILTLDQLQAFTNSLEQGVKTLTEVYGQRTGISNERLQKMMHDETWMSAEDALALGFVDEIIGPKEKSNIAPAVMNSIAAQSVLQHYVNVPAALRTSMRRQSVDLEREAQRLRDEVRLHV